MATTSTPTQYISYDRPMLNGQSMNGLATYEFLDDFDKNYPLTSNLPVTATSPYNAQASNTGTFSQATPTKSNGVAILSGAGTTTKSGVQIQMDQAVVILTGLNNYEWSVKLTFSDATNTDFFFGAVTNYGATGPILNGAELTPILSNLDTTHYVDGIGLYKQFGATSFYGVSMKSGVASSVTGAYGTATTATTVLGIQILMGQGPSGSAVVNFYQDGALLQTMNVTATGANLAPVIGFLSATASGTISTSLQYMYITNTR